MKTEPAGYHRCRTPSNRSIRPANTEHQRTPGGAFAQRDPPRGDSVDSKIIKAFIGLIAAFILVIAVFGILPQLGMKGPFENFQNPLAGLFEGGKNAAANAALDVSGLKSKAESALRGNADRIAEATGMSSSQVDAAIDALDIQSWEVTSLPEGAEKTGSANVSYSGTDATITTYDDPSVVTVTAMGQAITLAVPASAQTYLPFLSYLG